LPVDDIDWKKGPKDFRMIKPIAEASGTSDVINMSLQDKLVDEQTESTFVIAPILLPSRIIARLGR
jgi:hypothetical protein